MPIRQIKTRSPYVATHRPDENLPQHLSQMGPDPVGALYPWLTPLRRRGPGVSPQLDAKSVADTAKANERGCDDGRL
ncbi:hypothetical protein DPX16_10721 [Anabarilius grahami]|uniref:Uncharacterized protein n=1 Tax=Anabarilius grahami TaxID=495550 RepID=A0A3N0Z8L2_ANAGA|nr:hypothetical protein DPX16_10721 [Anabarilius grahami]